MPIVFLAAVYALIDKESRAFILSKKANGIWFALLAVLSVAVALIKGNYLGLICALGAMIPIFILAMFAQSVMDERLYSGIADTMMILSIPCALLGFIQKFFFIEVNGRVSSTFFNPNLYAYALGLTILICAFSYCLSEEVEKKTFCFATAAINAAVLLLTGCRSAFLAVFLGLLLLFILLSKKKLIVAVLVLGAAAVALILLFPHIIPRSDQLEEDFVTRIKILHEAWQGIIKDPVFGSGILSFKFLGLNDRETIHAHNTYVNILLDLGIVGVVFFIGYFIWAFKKLLGSIIKKSGNFKYAAFLLAVLLLTAVHSFTDVPLMGGQNGALLAILFAAINIGGRGAEQPNG